MIINNPSPLNENTTSSAFDFSYPFNGDVQGTYQALLLPEVKEIYTPFDSKLFGTPRVSKHEITSETIFAILPLVQETNTSINILLNPIVRPEKYYTLSGLKELENLIKPFIEKEIFDYTIGDMPLAIHLKNIFPEIKIHISATANINSLERAGYWVENVNVHEICVDTSKNKDIEFLKSLRSYTGCRIKIIVNESCLPNCPMVDAHRTTISLGIYPEQDINYTDVCQNIKNKQPWYIYSSGCITPKALYTFYQGVIDTVKFVGRQRSTTDNIGVILHYLDKDNENYFSLKNSPVKESLGVFQKVSNCDKKCLACKYCKVKYFELNDSVVASYVD